MRITRFDRWDRQLGSVRPLSATHEEALDGTDTLTITTLSPLEKGDRLVWRDAGGTWREHVVDECRRAHDAGGAAVTTAACINSVAETAGDFIESMELAGATVAEALSRVLAGTRWESAGSDVGGTHDFSFERVSVREALGAIVEAAGAGELHAFVSVGDVGVDARRVRIPERRGSQIATRRFTYARGAAGVRRTVESTDPVTALYLYGRASDDGRGGTARLTVESVNGGRRYVEDRDALARWGRPGADGTGREHRFGCYVDEGCEDASFLLAQGTRRLANLSSPEVTYEVEVADASDALAGVSVGDAVDVVDEGFEPALRMRERVTRVRRDLMMPGSGTVTVGARRSLLVRRYVAEREAERRREEEAERIEAAMPSWDAAARLDDSYLGSLMGALDGAGYVPSALSAGGGGTGTGGAGGGGGAREFPVVDDEADPSVALDDLGASALQGVGLSASYGGAQNNLLRASRRDGYGGVRVEVGMAARRLAEVEQYAAGGQLTLYVPSDSVADLSKRGFVRLADAAVTMRGPRAGLLAGDGSSYGTVQATAYDASMSASGYGVSVGGGAVDLHAPRYLSGILVKDDCIELGVGTQRLALRGDGLYLNGSKIEPG